MEINPKACLGSRSHLCLDGYCKALGFSGGGRNGLLGLGFSTLSAYGKGFVCGYFIPGLIGNI